MSQSELSPLPVRLRENPLCQQFLGHAFFQRVKDSAMTKDQVAVFIGQWWHPLHYFPTFLARSISVVPDIQSKSAISKILHQETGEGNPKRAHEIVYIQTMERVGFTKAQATDAAPFAETSALVAGYELASNDRLAAVGGIFATEAADLLMVSSIGTAVERVTGTTNLEWVNIHVQQEPDHTEEADHTLLRTFAPKDEENVMRSAEKMWRLWSAFFDRLEGEVFVSKQPRAALQSAA